MREGCARAALGLAEAGLDVIVELGLWDPWGRVRAAQIFSGHPAFVVRVRCDLATLDKRERDRGDRFLGTAARQAAELEGVPFDYDVATDHTTADALAVALLEWLSTNPTPVALFGLARPRR